MFKSTNKLIVESIQSSLKDMGVEAKTSHLYQALSKAAGFNSYQVAKSKDIDFRKIDFTNKKSMDYITTDNDLTPEKEEKLNKYIFNISKKMRPDVVWIGRTEDEKTNTVNFIEYPGLLIKGRSASVSIIYSVLCNLLLNPESYAVLLTDNLLTDKLRNQKQIKSLSYEFSGKVIDLYYEELIRRKNFFSKNQTNIFKANLSPIFLVTESFEALMEATKYPYNEDRAGSSAKKLKELLRIGRGYGIWFMAGVLDRNPSIPSSLKPGISTILSFEENNFMTATDEIGRNKFNFSDVSKDSIEAQLEKLKDKPSKLSFLTEITPDLYRINEGKTSPLSYEIKIPVSIFKSLDYELTIQENPVYPVSFTFEKHGKKVGVYWLTENKRISEIERNLVSVAKKYLNLSEVWLISREDLNYRDSGVFDRVLVGLDFRTMEAVLSEVHRLPSQEREDILRSFPLWLE